MQAGDVLKYMVTSKGLSSREASRMLGRSPNYVSRMYVGGFNIKAGTLAEFGEALGYELVLRDTSTGAEVTIEPPE